MSQEIELKLSLPQEALPALRRHPLFAGAARQGKAVTLDNTYYDTPDLVLKANRLAVRTRRQGRTWLQTVKCSAESSGGLTQRPEWEGPYDGAFDFAAVDVPEAARLLARHRDDLAPVFSTRFRRETRLHAPDGAVRILMMIDTGEVVAGERREPICELELELERGRPLDLLLLACRLVADVPVLPEDRSKAERGYRLHRGEGLRPLTAQPSAIEPGQSPVEAFRSLAFAAVRQWQANARGAAEDDDPEFIHQLRVALRRLRSLLRVFAPALPPGFIADWSERLRHNAAGFGDARDLDVFYGEILAPVIDAAGSDPALAQLARRAQGARDEARVATRANLDPAAQGRLLIGFSAALHALPVGTEADSMDLREFAREQLSGLRKKVRRRHEAAGDGVPSRLHALRIVVKRLRYGVEFFAPLMPAKAVKRYLQDLTRVQNALGFVHDLDVARARLAAWAGESPELRTAAAFVCRSHEARYARLSRRALRELEPLLWGKTPWSR